MSNPKINTEFIFNTTLFKNGDIVVNPTLAAGDVTVHTADTDKGSIDTLPTVTPSSQESVKVTLSTDEMNGAYLAIIFIDQTSPKAWDDLYISIETSANTVDEIKVDTAAILVDTADIQPNYATETKQDAAQTDLDTLTAGCTLAAGAITNASLAGNMEIVFETDFATNYNTTQNAWVNNYTDIIGTIGNASFAAGALTSTEITSAAGITLANGAITNVSLAGNMEIVFETDFATNYNTTRNAWVNNYTDIIGAIGNSSFAAGALTSTEITSAGGCAVTSISDIDAPTTWKASINTEVDNSIETYGLDHLISASVTGTDVADNSIIAKMVDDAATADWDGYDPTTASLEALNVDTDVIIDDLANGTDGLGAIKTDTAAILVDTADIQPNYATSSALATVDSNVDAILVDTNELQTDWVNGGRLDLILDARAAQTTVDNIETDTQNIQGRLPTALVNSRMDSTIDATGFEAAAVDLIWDEEMAGHTTADTSGLVMNDWQDGGRLDLILDTLALEATVAALNDIAAGDVWGVDATTQQTQGTFGQAIGDPIADTTTIYQAVATDAAGDNVSIDVVAVKAETALIVADTNELQSDDVPGLIAALNDVAATDIVSAGAITTLSGAVVNVDLTDTVTTYTGNTVQTGDSFARLGAPVAASISADIAVVDGNVDSILTDTAEIGTAGAGLTDLGGMSTGMKAEVNVEAKDVLFTDTVAELSGVPAANAALSDKINWNFLLARNKGTQTSSTKTILADDGSTIVATASISDDSTTFTRDEFS